MHITGLYVAYVLLLRCRQPCVACARGPVQLPGVAADITITKSVLLSTLYAGCFMFADVLLSLLQTALCRMFLKACATSGSSR
jgi:hypothetical protein